MRSLGGPVPKLFIVKQLNNLSGGDQTHTNGMLVVMQRLFGGIRAINKHIVC